MAHAGEELRLALARLRQLPALVLDFVEQADILDGDHCLIRKCSRQLDLPVGEGPYLGALQSDQTDWYTFTQQRCAQYSPVLRDLLRLRRPRIFRVGEHVGDLDRLTFQ